MKHQYVNQQKLIDMQKLYAGQSERGAKTPAEDRMVGMYTHATFDLNPRASSIDTPLHSFIPFKHVDHMHPNAAQRYEAKGGDAAAFGGPKYQALDRADYADYYDRCQRPGSPAMRDPNPTVTLIPGLGMVAWGKDKSESRVTAEFYNCAVEVMRGSEAIDEYITNRLSKTTGAGNHGRWRSY